MREFLEAPDFDTSPLVLKANEEISNYTAIFVLPDGRTGSGTFINACGVEGILTANHVADALRREDGFCLCVHRQSHYLAVSTKHTELVEIGIQGENLEDGPDLAFVIFRDAKLLGTLRSLKSFCYLESQNREFFESPHLNRMNWVIAGSPFEAVKVSQEGRIINVNFINFAGEAFFCRQSSRNGFDYFDLRILSGEGVFPQSYEGVSGGGIWLIPLEIDGNDHATIGYARPILAGVAFYQFPEENKFRVIRGHGECSIYVNVLNKLKSLHNQNYK
jgi:hypothetical protein